MADEFDPDAFLAEPTSQGGDFDPDAFLAEGEEVAPVNNEDETGILDGVADFGVALDETARTLGQNALAQVGSGFVGLGGLLTGGSLEESADAIEQFKADFSFQTENERSIAQQQDIGETISEAVAVPATLTKALTTESTPEELAAFEQQVKDEGLVGMAQEDVFQKTGSPLAALLV